MKPTKEILQLVIGTWELRRNYAIREYHECKTGDRVRETALNECIDDLRKILSSPKKDTPNWLKP